MPTAPRIALFALTVAAVACGALSDRNSRLGSGRDTCLDLDSECTESHQCCSSFCANGVCVKRER
jgi:hypothetical protein